MDEIGQQCLKTLGGGGWKTEFVWDGIPLFDKQFSKKLPGAINDVSVHKEVQQGLSLWFVVCKSHPTKENGNFLLKDESAVRKRTMETCSPIYEFAT